jgi:hypothetical protein
MNRHICALLVSNSLLLSTFVTSAATNFTTQGIIHLGPTDASDPWPKTEDAAREPIESVPAEQDAEGNWSPVVARFQVSVRMRKATYATGEPIVARVIVRNVSDTPTSFWCMSGCVPFDITLLDDFGPPQLLKNPLWMGSAGPLQLPPASQWKLHAALHRYPELTNVGTHTFQYTRPIQTETGLVKVTSSPVKFSVREATPEEIAARIANTPTNAPVIPTGPGVVPPPPPPPLPK